MLRLSNTKCKKTFIMETAHYYEYVLPICVCCVYVCVCVCARARACVRACACVCARVRPYTLFEIKQPLVNNICIRMKQSLSQILSNVDINTAITMTLMLYGH